MKFNFSFVWTRDEGCLMRVNDVANLLVLAGWEETANELIEKSNKFNEKKEKE